MVMRRLTLLMAGALLLSACAAGPIVSDDFEESAPAGVSTTLADLNSGSDGKETREPMDTVPGSEDAATPGSDIESSNPVETTIPVVETIPEDGAVVDPPTPPVTTIVTTPPVVTGEVPAELMAAIMADAGTRNTTKAALTVVRAQAVTWSDGSLGCPEKGMSYTQALVDGYWVVLDAGGQLMDYRAGTSGGFKYCAIGGLPPVGSGNT